MSLLSVRDLEVLIETRQGSLRAVDGLNFDLAAGDSLGIVGESGSGKTQTALALMGLLARNAQARGSVNFAGEELLRLKPRAMNRLRGAQIGMVFQDPLASLNPHLTIGTQLTEVLERHEGVALREARSRAVQMLERVHLADAAGALKRYPHEFSGGMRQRITIAMALLCDPQLLIADEPTSALDVTVQAQILDLLAELRQSMRLAVILISHDIGVVAELCRQTLVMYAGRIMEIGPTAQLLAQPAHPYTKALLASRPHLDGPRRALLDTIPGQPPRLTETIEGCPFHPRCSQVFATCRRARPVYRVAASGTLSACHAENS